MRSHATWFALALTGCVASPAAPVAPQPAGEPLTERPQSEASEAPDDAPPVEPVPLPAGYTCAPPPRAAPEPPKAIPVIAGVPVVDAKRCEAAQYGIAKPMGSRSVEVVGASDTGCQVEITEEMEGGYTVWGCTLGPSGRVKIPPGYEESSMCVELRSGNVFFDQQPLQRDPGIALMGDGFVTRVEERQSGGEAAVEPGNRVRLEVQFYEDREYTRPIGDGPQTVSIELTEGTRPNLARALLDHDDELYRAKVGAVRRVTLREEVAEGLEAFGPFADEALLCLEVTVSAAESAP